MAEFNPQTPDIRTPDFTGASRQSGPDKSLEYLFSGIGDVLNQTVKTADTFVQNKIEDNVRYGFDALNDEMKVSSDVVPTELTQSQTGLQRLAQAQIQGKVTPEYYYQRLAATVKGLRARYPGYEKEVDDIVQKVTGSKPANAFRNELFKNLAQAQSELTSKANKVDTYIRQNADKLNTDEIDDYTQTGGSKYGGAAGLQQTIMKRTSIQAQEAYERTKATQDKSRAEDTYNVQLSRRAASGLSQVADSLGMSGENFSETLSKAAAGNGLTDQQIGVMRVGLDNLINGQRQKMVELGAQEGFSTIPVDRRQKLIEAALQPYQDLKAMLDNKNISGAAQLVARIKAREDEALDSMYQKIPQLATAKAASTISPDLGAKLGGDLISNKFGTSMRFLNAIMVRDGVNASVSGQMSASEFAAAVRDNPRMSATQKSQTLAGFINGFTTMASQVPQTGAEVEGFVQKNYAMAATDDQLWQSVQSDQKMLLFNKMFNPTITGKIAKSGSKAAMEVYQNAAVARFQSIPEFVQAAGTLSQNLPYAQYLNARYNPDTNRLELTVDQSSLNEKGFFTRTDNQSRLAELTQFANTFNRGLSTIVPIIEAAGGDETQGVQRLLKTLNLNLEGGKQTGIFGWINQKLDTVANATGEALKERPFGNPVPLGDTGEVTFPALTEVNLAEVKPAAVTSDKPLLQLLSRAEGTEQRGYDDELAHGAYSAPHSPVSKMTLDQVDKIQSEMLKHPANPFNSSAIGRYQIVQTTLRGLRKQLGLTGNEVYDAALQDRLAEQLLKNRGINEWRAGKMTDQEFLSNLGQEWASLPGGRQPNAKVRPEDVTNTARRDTRSGLSR